ARAPRSATPPAPAMKRVTTTATRRNLETVRVRRNHGGGAGFGHFGEPRQKSGKMVTHQVVAIQGRGCDQVVDSRVEVHQRRGGFGGPDARMVCGSPLFSRAEQRFVELL